MSSISLCTHDEVHGIDRLVNTLASAFSDDPVLTYCHRLPPKERPEKLNRLFTKLVTHEVARPPGESALQATEDGISAAIWHRDGYSRVQPSVLKRLRHARSLASIFGLRGMCRLCRVLRSMDFCRPVQPHLYLYVIGTCASAQGKGLASFLLEETLRHCDHDQVPVYLESTNERNLPFFQRHGFEVVWMVRGLPTGCPPIFCLWREPQASAA